MSSGIERVGGEGAFPPRVVRVRKKSGDDSSFEQELGDRDDSAPQKPSGSESHPPEKKTSRGSDGETGTQLDVTA